MKDELSASAEVPVTATTSRGLTPSPEAGEGWKGGCAQPPVHLDQTTKNLTCIIVGGGYAGINAIKAIQQTFRAGAGDRRLNLILIDKQPYHLRKVLLFKPAARPADVTIPFERMFPEGLQVMQGTVTKVDSADKQLHYLDAAGNQCALGYDMLVVTVGSVVRQPDPEQGGIALTGVDAAAHIRERWHANLRQAAVTSDADERRRLLTVAVAGAGISGIEASAELGYAMRDEAQRLGIDPSALRICLVNAQDRLFPEGPARAGRKLERALGDCHVTVLHGRKALHERDGRVALSDGETLSVGLCVWTLGLLPNPVLRTFGLPLTPAGQLIIDASYRVQDAPGVYSIGDCAQVVDPASGRADGQTCKEAIAQADRLAQILLADLHGRPAPVHTRHRDLFCFGLGPERGMVWTRQWGLDIIMTGRLGWKIRQFTWDSASLVN